MSFGPEDILRTQMAQEAFNASQTIAKLKSELATLRAESDALKRERDELFRWRMTPSQAEALFWTVGGMLILMGMYLIYLSYSVLHG